MSLQVLSRNGPSDAVDNDNQISFPSGEDEARRIRPFAHDEKCIPVKVNSYSTLIVIQENHVSPVLDNNGDHFIRNCRGQ